jgi:hypothetical protein
MVRRRGSFSFAIALGVLFLSVGIDIYTVRSAKPVASVASQGKVLFPMPGPRRYPPGYHTAAFVAPDSASSIPGGGPSTVGN